MKIRKLLSTMALSAIVASNALATEPVKVEWGDPVKQPWGDPSDPEGANVCSWFQWGQDLWFDYNNDGLLSMSAKCTEPLERPKNGSVPFNGVSCWMNPLPLLFLYR